MTAGPDAAGRVRDAAGGASAGGAWIVTGISAAGKSTVAVALADRFSRSVVVEGDAIRAMVRRGRAEMRPDPPPEALAQLRLRYEAAAALVDRYAAAGFTCVWEDVILGPLLDEALGLLATRPRRLVVLAPQARAVTDREAARDQNGYHSFDVAGLDRLLREGTPRLGLWLDTSGLSVEATVDALLAREREALV